MASSGVYFARIRTAMLTSALNVATKSYPEDSAEVVAGTLALLFGEREYYLPE